MKRHSSRYQVAPGFGLVFPRAWWLVVAALFWSSAAAAQGITSPGARDRVHTAYGLGSGQGEVDVGLLGVDTEDVFARLGAGVGLGYGVEVSSNIAHNATALFNLAGKVTFLDTPHAALAFQFSPIFGRGKWIWAAPEEHKDIIEQMNMWILPFSVFSSFPVQSWLQFDLEATYIHAEIFGQTASESLVFDAQIGVRQLYFRPRVHVYVMDRVDLSLQALLPVWTVAPAEIDAEVELAPGVKAGARSGGWETTRFRDAYSVGFGARSMITQSVFVRFGLNFSQATESLYGSVVYPNFAVEGRF